MSATKINTSVNTTNMSNTTNMASTANTANMSNTSNISNTTSTVNYQTNAEYANIEKLFDLLYSSDKSATLEKLNNLLSSVNFVFDDIFDITVTIIKHNSSFVGDEELEAKNKELEAKNKELQDQMNFAAKKQEKRAVMQKKFFDSMREFIRRHEQLVNF
jgi:hypothetical protein